MTYANPSALVSTDWLNGHLDDPSIRIIEVDEDTSLYETDHIPGAIAWSWSDDLHHPVRRDYLDQDGFSGLLSAAGVGPESTVVLYGGNNNWFAAYAYWLLKYRGFDNVKLLDGGRKKWQLESLPLVSEQPSITPTDYAIAGQERPEIRVSRRRDRQARDGDPDRRAVTRGVQRPEIGTRPPAARAAVRSRTRPRGSEHPVGEGRQRRRDLQVPR